MSLQELAADSGGYELIDHTADIGVRAWGETKSALFTHAGLALFDLITDRWRVDSTVTEAVTVSGIDASDLLINWLRELLFFWTGETRLVRSVEVTFFTDTEITGKVAVASYNPGHHGVRHDIKAVTYHQVAVRQLSECWEAEIIFDV